MTKVIFVNPSRAECEFVVRCLAANGLFAWVVDVGRSTKDGVIPGVRVYSSDQRRAEEIVSSRLATGVE